MREALRISASQGAEAFRLRAAVALGEMLRAKGSHQEATALLDEVLATWCAGEETNDLLAAREIAAGAPAAA